MMMDHFMVRLSSYYQYSNKYVKNNTSLIYVQEKDPQLYYDHYTFYAGEHLNRRKLKPILKVKYIYLFY